MKSVFGNSTAIARVASVLSLSTTTTRFAQARLCSRRPRFASSLYVRISGVIRSSIAVHASQHLSKICQVAFGDFRVAKSHCRGARAPTGFECAAGIGHRGLERLGEGVFRGGAAVIEDPAGLPFAHEIAKTLKGRYQRRRSA